MRVPAAIRLGLMALTAFAASATMPVAAGAATGTSTLALGGPAAKALRAAGVEIDPAGAASGGARRIVLPVAAGLAGTETTLLRARGAISLQGRDRSLRLAKLALLLGVRPRVGAQLGDKDLVLFRVLPGGKREVDPVTGSVELRGLQLKLTRAAARAISRRLGLEGLRAGRFATLSASVDGLSPSSTPKAEPEQRRGCPLPSGPGPAPEDPLPVATRPPAASDVTAATLEWQVRESFIRYIGSGEGTSVSGGATADPPVLLPGASASLSYGFHFPLAHGWFDPGANPASPADDKAAIYFGGAVRFLYSAHEIDLTTADPEIEIAADRSRAIFAIDEGSGAQRQVLVNLDLSRAAAIGRSGSTYTYERVPGAIPAGTAGSVFAGFYAPGTEFGCFTVSFTAGA